jgi:hypothetical protein
MNFGTVMILNEKGITNKVVYLTDIYKFGFVHSIQVRSNNLKILNFKI